MIYIIIFSPLWIFLTTIIVVFVRIGKFTLKDIISETQYPIKIEPNTLYDQGKIKELLSVKSDNSGLAASLSKIYPPTIQTTQTSTKISVSRLIALITSMLSILVVLLVCCLYIECYIHTKPFPDLSGLVGVFVSLGLGVVPYSFNKVSTAIASKKAGNNITNLQ